MNNWAEWGAQVGYAGLSLCGNRVPVAPFTGAKDIIANGRHHANATVVYFLLLSLALRELLDRTQDEFLDRQGLAGDRRGAEDDC